MNTKSHGLQVSMRQLHITFCSQSLHCE